MRTNETIEHCVLYVYSVCVAFSLFCFSRDSHSACETVHVLSVKWHFNLSHRVYRVQSKSCYGVTATAAFTAVNMKYVVKTRNLFFFFVCQLLSVPRRRCFITDELNETKEMAVTEPIVMRMYSRARHDNDTARAQEKELKTTTKKCAELVGEHWAEWYARSVDAREPEMNESIKPLNFVYFCFSNKRNKNINDRGRWFWFWIQTTLYSATMYYHLDLLWNGNKSIVTGTHTRSHSLQMKIAKNEHF